jgi:hypothetical protein
VARSVNYDNQAAPKGMIAQVKISEQPIPANTPNFASVLSGLSLPNHIGNGAASPRDRVRHRGRNRHRLHRFLAPDRDGMHESRRRLLLPAGDEDVDIT